METIPAVSPLEALVVMELESIRFEQERLSQVLPVLALQANPEQAQMQFERDMVALQQHSNRLERLLDGMSSWGSDTGDMLPLRGFPGELTAA